MMEIEKPKILLEEQENGARAVITVEPLEKGFGITIGNMLRRTLLSSLPGAAIVGVKIKNVLHEFSTIKGVSEDVPDIVLNLKAVAVKTENATIRPGDTFRCIQFQKGRELYMDNFTRNGEPESLDTRYVVGKTNGLTTLEHIKV